MSIETGPQITPDKFSLDRLLVSLGNCWIVPLNVTLAGSGGGGLMQAGASQSLIVTGVSIDSSVAVSVGIILNGTMTAPVVATPINRLLNSARVPTFTANTSTSAVPGATYLYRFNLTGSIDTIYIDWSNKPLILPAGSTQLLGFASSSITGSVYVSFDVQEYPY